MEKLTIVTRITIAVFLILISIIGYLTKDKLDTINDGIDEVKEGIETVKDKYIDHEIRITKLEAKQGTKNNQ